MSLKRVGLIFVLLAFTACAEVLAAAPPETGFLKRSVAFAGGQRGYRVYIPENFDPKKKYPVVLFLHGAKQWGEDNEGQINFGLPAMMRPGGRIETKLGADALGSFIGVFPQTRPEEFWIGEIVEYAVKALDQTVAEFDADPSRLYATGFSMGGYGSWYVAAKHPGKFAAIAPVGGNIKIPERFPRAEMEKLVPPDMRALYFAADPHAAFVKAVGKTPVWVFHGDQDEAVPVSDARATAAALKAAGVSFRYTEYENTNHFMFDRAYTEPGFWQWLLSQRLAR
ncbi:MAG TPA: prolyl oligopeptidase family serine peptidase [Pyrinomonadaceae bacterium]|nr:prolyl oligopeptidase family serine peptidase [Pyrinomonadaceae bacterium]